MDLKLFTTDNATGFDIALDGHDLATDSGLTTAVMVSLYTDRRADNDDEIPDGTTDRRGCWMDMFDDHIQGSRLWLLGREKELPNVLQRAREYAEEALQWLIDKGVVMAVSVTAERAGRGMLALRVVLTLPDNSQFDDVFNYSLEAI
jgi:phage gp46-like protein